MVEGGTIAGRYRLETVIGTGGMSRVWLAHDEILDRQVAVKEILPIDGLPADLWTRTIQEGRAAARLTHPNVVRTYDVLFTGGRPWIVMEYVVSRSLETLVRERGPLPPAEAARIGLAVLDGLAAAHRAGVLHRDVKPPNVLIADDGRILLGDFGVAIFDSAGGSPERGPLVASPGYVAPERVRDGISTAHGDLWSFGATLYWSVEGRPPYSRPTTVAQLLALATEEPDPLLLAGPLAPVIEGLLQRSAGERLTATRARLLLASLPPVPAEPSPAPRRSRRPAWIGGALALAVLAAGIVATTRRDPDDALAAAKARSSAQAQAQAERGCADAGTPPVPPGPDAAPVVGGPEPDGRISHTDPAGFRVAVPDGWSRSTDAGSVCFVDPHGERRFTVGASAPDREFTYAGPDGRRWHALQRGLGTGGFAVSWTTPDADWPAAQAQFQAITRTFAAL